MTASEPAANVLETGVSGENRRRLADPETSLFVYPRDKAQARKHFAAERGH